MPLALQYIIRYNIYIYIAAELPSLSTARSTMLTHLQDKRMCRQNEQLKKGTSWLGTLIFAKTNHVPITFSWTLRSCGVYKWLFTSAGSFTLWNVAWLRESVLNGSLPQYWDVQSETSRRHEAVLPSIKFVETLLTELDRLILPPYLDSDQKITVKTISAFEGFQKSKLWKDCNWDDVMSGDGCLHLSVQQSNHEKTSNYFKANQNLILNLSASHCIQYIAPPSFLLPHLGETGSKTFCASCVSSHSLCKRKWHR